MGDMGLVSVVVPVYNSEVFLERCVNSILNQTYNNIEVILINDGSNDSSGEICDLLARQDKRVKVLHQPNSGVSTARNNGINKAKGKFIQFVDSDDYIEDIMTEILIKEMNKELDIVMCGYKRINIDTNGKEIITNSNVYKKSYINKKEFLEDFGVYFKDMYINFIWNKLYRADIIKDNDIYYDKSIGWGEDLIFNLSYLKYCDKISIIEDLFYNYVNYNDGSITSTFNKNLYSNQQSMYTNIRKFLIENNSYYGKNKDIIETRYTNRMISCINNLFHEDADYNTREIRTEINNIMGNEMFFKNLEYLNSSGLQRRIIGILIKRRYVNLIIFYFKMINLIKSSINPLYQILVKLNSYTKGEKQTGS